MPRPNSKYTLRFYAGSNMYELRERSFSRRADALEWAAAAIDASIRKGDENIRLYDGTKEIWDARSMFAAMYAACTCSKSLKVSRLGVHSSDCPVLNVSCLTLWQRARKI